MSQFHTFHYHWTWNLLASPTDLWPLVADTNRFNRDTGLPPLQSASDVRQPNARRFLHFRRMGILVEWEEDPFEWVYPHHFGVTRHYTHGPVAEMQARVILEPHPEGGTQLTYEVWATPKNLLGLLAIPIQIGWISARQFSAIFHQYDHQATSQPAAAPSTHHVQLTQGAQGRLENIHRQLLQSGFSGELVEKLISLTKEADDLDLVHIRPYALADAWQSPRRKTLELFLWATRLGLLEFRWDTLCPHCRKSPSSLKSLHEIEASQHCPSCDADFTVNFDQTVELTFRPNPAIRKIRESQQFCIAGPQTTPHVVVQELIRPGEESILMPNLDPGQYRLRLLETPGNQALQVSPEGEMEATFRIGPEGWEVQKLWLSTSSRLIFENALPSEQLFILERTAWNAQATPAADVTALQTFRDLFASEALRPNEAISVGSLVLVFTDLRGSTRLYREVGDATAFGSVMEHFDVLREEIAKAGGAVVKTIGDAVMAVFRRPVETLQVMLNAQRLLALPAPGSRPFWLKVSIQYGPVIAINANDLLDYFGTQVNLAARMVELSTGEDIIISESVFQDPEVSAFLADESIQINPFTAALKGFEPDGVNLWSVKRSLV
jgi:class 3 adenylate cyclase